MPWTPLYFIDIFQLVNIGCLPFVGKIRLASNRCIIVSDFPNSTDQPDEIALTIYLSGVSFRSSRKRHGFIQMVRNFPPFRSKWKKRSTSEGTPQFPKGISGKLPYHLTSNRNFRIFCQMVSTRSLFTSREVRT